jgi:uncharacterized damage-inducible protein DinB
MLRPLPDFDDADRMAQVGRLFALREHWRDAMSQLRDALTEMQSTNEQTQAFGLERASEALDRLKALKELGA